MTIDWENYLSDEAKLREPSVMKMMGRFGKIISLGAGLPHPDCFPIKNISIDSLSPNSNFIKTESNSVHMDDKDEKLYEALQYTSGRGTSYLDPWCHDHIEKYHKPKYNDWDSLLSAGATQSLESVLRLLCNSNEDTILSEELTYPAFLETCKPLRIKVIPIKVDSDGACPSSIDYILSNWNELYPNNSLKKPKLFYTMPVGQNPLGSTMPLKRREDIYKICQKHNIIIIEDDPYYHLQLDCLNGSDPLPSLLNFDNDGRVIRFDSFSKILMPGSRCSFITANKVFIEKLTRHNEVNIHSSAAPSQLILHELIKNWDSNGNDGFEKWLNYLKIHYFKRRKLLNDEFEKYLPKKLCCWNFPNSGMFLWIDIIMSQWPIPSNLKLTHIEWVKLLEDTIFDTNVEKGVLLAKGHWFMVDSELDRIGFRATFAFADEIEFSGASERFADSLNSVYEKFYGVKP
ncbi:hypothetical protein CANARDRAFT_201835 [[Candida] arabinofermentans NRRL YB-2248]|uniref:Aminotransferase class I/classII large domain-containing protein n=1 Tax=[Candida] arabinofermentans NRRL YB-2248 TaxID=983967 RepID=A0A1E4SWX9_9ASCO|nr:hypothetical protein CANARDRAFT_201835 [[Candida] arabinofermentans NRRL YB-2248]